MSEYVKPNEKTVLLEPDQVVCHTDDKLRLLVIVYSSPVHYERRRVIRKTWGKEFSTYPGVKLAFLLGQSTKNLENDIGKGLCKSFDTFQRFNFYFIVFLVFTMIMFLSICILKVRTLTIKYKMVNWAYMGQKLTKIQGIM